MKAKVSIQEAIDNINAMALEDVSAVPEPDTRRVMDFHEDAGHGWLKVHTEELERLGLLESMSKFSYQSKGWAFLEEDRDISIYFREIERLTGQAWEDVIRLNNIYSHNWVGRNYPSIKEEN